MKPTRLTADEAFLALMILALEVDHDPAPREAARAELFIHELPRFNARPRATVGRLIERMRDYVRDHDDGTVIAAACKAIPRASRAAALAIVATMASSDGRLQRAEATFVWRLADAMGLSSDDAATAIMSSGS